MASLPLAPSLDTPGPMARSVEMRRCCTASCRSRPLDPRTLGAPPLNDPMRAAARRPKGRASRACREPSRGLHPEVLAAYDEAIDALGRLGAEIVDLALPCRFDDATGQPAGSSAPRRPAGPKLVDDPALPIDPAVRPRIHLGRGISAPTSRSALRPRCDEARLLAAFEGSMPC